MYERVSDRDFRDVWKTLKEVDARFWHAVKGWEAVPRTSCNNYRAALVYRGPDDTLYFVCRALYVIPESEYRFIEGDVNVMIAKDLEVYEAYVDAKVESFATDMDPSEVEGVPKFERRIDSYPIVPLVNEIMVKHYDQRHGLTSKRREKWPGSVLEVGLDATKPKFNAKVAEKAPVTTPKPQQQAEIRPLVASSKPKCAPATPKVVQVPKSVQNEPKTAPRTAQKRNQAKRTVVRAEKEPFDPLKGVVNPRPQDKSGWKGTRKRRSCVTTRNAYDSADGCLAIGAMFARSVR